ncbi:quinone oxidoreductase family protein [Amycolatopsis sp. H20-H5]|uniref:quinone oxidoreductase family protein n=1 Tax=Amycolatopsis sp. H20-H5 TaxID=3046309 RepID=UPI002DBA53C9|nr:quinone oxidoreductase [Amycolatopsis sp. H20-H5]MEC3976906.1 quinone oxidoreductase [Amycolatopsis sp. H20-H5]
MRRVVFDAYGPPDVLRTVDGEVPEPGEGQVLVRVAAAGVNFVDLYQRSGAYTVRFPFTPGFEGSGTILGVGPGVPGFAAGDRVAWAGSPNSYATHCLVKAERLVPVPDALDLDVAAAVLIQGMTAHFLASDVVTLPEGATCLVHAAAGGVGALLCQLAVLRGAKVIGTVSSAAKAEVAQAAGAGHVIDYSAGDFAERVKEITGGEGVDVVYDAVGRDTFEAGLTCLRPRGTFVLYGQTSGPAAPLDPQVLNARGSLFLTKASLGHYDKTREQLLHRAGEVFAAVVDGSLRPRVHQTYTLADAPEAHREIESRNAIGKVLLRP